MAHEMVDVPLWSSSSLLYRLLNDLYGREISEDSTLPSLVGSLESFVLSI